MRSVARPLLVGLPVAVREDDPGTDVNDSYSSVLANFDQAQHPTDEHTGYNNDPDMMEVGRNGLTDAQSRSHMGLWAISGAPMLAGNDLATMSSTTASILTNSEVIAVDQDTRGLQGVKVAEDSLGLQAYAKVLAGSGKRAVLLLNRTSSAATMTARWADMGLTTASASVRNVWSATTVGSYATSYSTSVPANDSVLLTVTGTEAASTMYEAEASGTHVAVRPASLPARPAAAARRSATSATAAPTP